LLHPILPGNGPQWRHFRLSPGIEDLLSRGLQEANGVKALTLSPEDLQELLSAHRTELTELVEPCAVVVSRADLRPYLLYLLREEWPGVPVLARSDLVPSLQTGFTGFPVISLD